MEPWLKKELHWITCDLKRKSVLWYVHTWCCCRTHSEHSFL